MAIPILGGNQPADQGEYTPIKDDGPRIRLLYCYNCQSIQELPMRSSPHPDDDPLLQILIDQHESAGIQHKLQLADVGVFTWSEPKRRAEIIKNMRTKYGGGLADIDPEYYTTKATFYDDAMSCYSKHFRPQGSCPDWRDSSKRLLPQSTVELRKEYGLMSAAKSQSTKVYLCDFCPVKSTFMNKMNDKKKDL